MLFISCKSKMLFTVFIFIFQDSSIKSSLDILFIILFFVIIVIIIKVLIKNLQIQHSKVILSIPPYNIENRRGNCLRIPTPNYIDYLFAIVIQHMRIRIFHQARTNLNYF